MVTPWNNNGDARNDATTTKEVGGKARVGVRRLEFRHCDVGEALRSGQQLVESVRQSDVSEGA